MEARKTSAGGAFDRSIPERYNTGGVRVQTTTRRGCFLVGTLSILFFDVDDTLYSTSAFSRQARRSAVEAMVEAGLGVPVEVCMRELDEVTAEFGSNYERATATRPSSRPPPSSPTTTPSSVTWPRSPMCLRCWAV